MNNVTSAINNITSALDQFRMQITLDIFVPDYQMFLVNSNWTRGNCEPKLQIKATPNFYVASTTSSSELLRKAGVLRLHHY